MASFVSADTAYVDRSATFALAAGRRTITLAGINTGGLDRTTLVDAVHLRRVDDATTRTVYDGANPYADFQGDGDLVARYLHGPAVDFLLARTGAAGATAWYLTDRLGSVRDLVDAAGVVLNHVAHDSYGNVTGETNPAQGDRFKYTGRELDAATGLQYNRHRYYDAAIGAWTQEDPIGFRGGDANLARYVGNNPTNFTDPSGLAPNRAGTTDPSHVLNRMRALEARGLTPDRILTILRDEHRGNENRYFYADQFG